VLFWVASGLIALVIAFPATKSILASHGFPRRLVTPFVGLSGVMEISAGILIAFRRTVAIGLVAGMFISLGHMVGTAIVARDLWIEPLGSLVKRDPAIVLMLVALLTLDDR
jgi:hypothetical protein